MEKRAPHYNLVDVQMIVEAQGALAFTRTAIVNGHAMGLTTKDMVEVICTMTSANFYKSMTTYYDHTSWQDVYHAMTRIGAVAYIKISDPKGHGPVIQFKEK